MRTLILVYALAVGQLINLEEVPSKILQESFVWDQKHYGGNYYAGYVTDINQRVNLTTQAWGLATKTSPIDNRAYLMALAVDLHNSLPAAPPGRWYGPGDDMPPKEETNVAIRSRLPINQAEWEAVWDPVKQNPEKALPFMKEMLYLSYYTWEKAKLDNPKAEPSIEATAIDLAKPTYYHPMQAWMAKQATAMTEGIAPWEAETWTRVHVEGLPAPEPSSTEVTGAATPPTPTEVTPPVERAAQTPKPMSPEPPSAQPALPTPAAPWWPWALVVAAVAVVALLVTLRRRK